MVTDFFGTFLQDISQALQIPNLHADANNSCLIKFKGNNSKKFKGITCRFISVLIYLQFL